MQVNGKEVKRVSRKIDELHAEVEYISGKLGVVIEQNRHKLTAPRVKLFFSTKTNLPFAPVMVDLADRQTQDRIVAREPREKWSFPYLDDLWTDQVT